MTIYCPKCDQHLPEDRFCAAYIKPNTRRLTCKTCAIAIARVWRLANPDKARSYSAKSNEKRRTQDAANLTGRIIHCAKCDRGLPAEKFYKAYVGPNTTRGKCRECSVRVARDWVASNPEKAATWRSTSPKLKKWASDWGKKNRALRSAYQNKWREKNRESVRARSNDRTAAARGARTPAWADRKAIREIYKEALRLTKQTGIQHHVDHIIPVNGKNVCGLHVETNLQILTATANLRKHNKIVEAVL